mgnify:CR=1 FL=1
MGLPEGPSTHPYITVSQGSSASASTFRVSEQEDHEAHAYGVQVWWREERESVCVIEAVSYVLLPPPPFLRCTSVGFLLRRLLLWSGCAPWSGTVGARRCDTQIAPHGGVIVAVGGGDDVTVVVHHPSLSSCGDLLARCLVEQG